jgi:hypothetical protein
VVLVREVGVPQGDGLDLPGVEADAATVEAKLSVAPAPLMLSGFEIAEHRVAAGAAGDGVVPRLTTTLASAAA